MKPINLSVLLLLVALCCIQCSNDATNKVNNVSQADTPIVQEKPQEKITEQLSVNYHLLSVEENKQWLGSLTAGDTLNALLLLNRVDKKHLLNQDTLIVPDTFLANHALYAPFPDIVTALKPINKILFASYYSQAFAVYENGFRVRWGAVSLGKKTTPTDTGLYFTNWKSRKTTSTVDPSWVMEWYFNLDNFGGVSMHEYALPGYPASHACMRLYKEDAYWLYHWADQWKLSKQGKIAAYGTPVIIYGSYPFNGRKPWLNLSENNKAIYATPEEITSVVTHTLQLILERQSQRDTLLSSSK